MTSADTGALGTPARSRTARATQARGRESSLRTRYSRRDYVLRRALVVADAAGITLSAIVALMLGQDTHATDVWLTIAALPAWFLLFRAYGLYERDVKKVHHAVLDDLPNLFHALVMGGLGLWTIYRLGPTEQLSALQVFAFGLVGLILIPACRTTARRGVAHAFGPERVAFLGDSPLIPALVRKMRQHGEYGLNPIGQVRSHSNGHTAPAGLRYLGSLDDVDLRTLAAELGIERVIVAADDVEDHVMLEILQRSRTNIKVSLLPDHVHAMGPALEVADVEGITLLDLNPLVLSRSARTLKRAVDVLGSAVALTLLAPVMAAIATAIKFDDRGPVFFTQRRIGRGGKPFRLVKFRTMVPDAESRVAELWAHSQDPNWLKLEHDPRITRVGRFLRLTSLDELPQLWNVLRGDMSLVGPRPLAESEDRQVQGWERTRLDLAPGITGPWQVMGRTNIPFEEMTKLDYIYVTNWSLWMDIKLVLQTLPAILTRRGAN